MEASLTIVAIAIFTLAIGSVLGYLTRQTIAKKQVHTAEGKASKIVEEATQKSQEILIEAKNKAVNILEEAKKKEQERENQIMRSEERLDKREESIDRKMEEIDLISVRFVAESLYQILQFI